MYGKKLCLLHVLFVADGQFVTPFSTATCQNFAPVLTAHTRAKAMLIAAPSAGWLKCSFHRYIDLSSEKLPLFSKVRQR